MNDSIDAARWRRLCILGAAPMGSKNLDAGTVLRFQSLEQFVDDDLAAHPSRGEAKANPLPADPVREALVMALDRAATMLERVTRKGGFVVGCDAAAKEARAAIAKANGGAA